MLQPENPRMESAFLYPLSYCDGSPVNEVCPTSGITELNAQHLLIYPNPATAEIMISLSDNENHSVIIKDMMGRVVFESDDVTVSTKINVSVLKSGNYIVLVDNLHTTKLIKN